MVLEEFCWGAGQVLVMDGCLARLRNFTPWLGEKLVFIGPKWLFERIWGEPVSRGTNQEILLDYDHKPQYDRIYKLADYISELQVDGLVGFGGGAVLDSVKQLAYQLKKDYFLIPLSAATCSAVSPVSVIYNSDNSFLEYDYPDYPASRTLIDPEFLVNQPENFLLAGCFDLLAKIYEGRYSSSRLLSLSDESRSVNLSTALYFADLCLELVVDFFDGLTEDPVCFNSKHKQLVTAAVIYSQQLSFLGASKFNASAIHSLANGITTVVKQPAMLHGIMILKAMVPGLILMEMNDELARLRFWLKHPRFKHLFDSIVLSSQVDIEKIAVKALSEDETIYNISGINFENVVRALKQSQNMIIYGGEG